MYPLISSYAVYTCMSEAFIVKSTSEWNKSLPSRFQIQTLIVLFCLLHKHRRNYYPQIHYYLGTVNCMFWLLSVTHSTYELMAD